MVEEKWSDSNVFNLVNNLICCLKIKLPIVFQMQQYKCFSFFNDYDSEFRLKKHNALFMPNQRYLVNSISIQIFICQTVKSNVYAVVNNIEK